MVKKTIKYEDVDGNIIQDEFYFHLKKSEIAELEMSTKGGLENTIKTLTETQDGAQIIDLIKKIILMAYGVPSADRKTFRKKDENGRPLSVEFEQTDAYSELFMELVQDADAAAKFMEGIIPKVGSNPAKVTPMPGAAPVAVEEKTE